MQIHACERSSAADAEQLDLEVEHGVAGDRAHAALAVAVRRPDLKLGDLAQRHLGDADIPTFNHISGAEPELEGADAAEAAEQLLRGVEDGAVLQLAGVVLNRGGRERSDAA